MATRDPSWLAPAGRAELGEGLTAFLRALSEGRAEAPRPLLPERATLLALYAAPPPDLVEGLRRCVDRFLIELGPDAARWGTLDVPPHVWGMALAVYSCLTPAPAAAEDVADPAAELAACLTVGLPPARTPAEALVYHALLHDPAEALPHLAPARANVMRNLLHRSPLSAAYHPHVDTPRPLRGLADQLLPGARGRPLPLTPWRDRADWLGALLPLLGRPDVARWLRRRWLALAETRPACRNLGLLLEALRQHGDGRDFLLRFYEAYDYFAGGPRARPGAPGRWPLLARVEPLLRAGGDSTAAILLNRRGHEYFLKFYPLIQLVIAEGGVPRDYRLLTRDFVLRLQPLWRLTAYRTGGATHKPLTPRFAGERGRT